LTAKANELGIGGLLAIRNFDLITYDAAVEGEMGAEVDRLEVVKRTGTDRDEGSTFWNANGHDYDHEQNPAGKTAANLIYAYLVHLTGEDYLVHYDGEPEVMDLTESLTDANGILVFDAKKLKRVAKNELWFESDPREALLMVFVCRT
jgi:hypothetical protein